MVFDLNNYLRHSNFSLDSPRFRRNTLIRLLTLLFFLFRAAASSAQTEISADDIYAQVMSIEKETELVASQFKPQIKIQAWRTVQFDVKPQHVWMAFYMLQMKVVAFRGKEGIARITPVDMEAVRNFDSSFNWVQAQRTLAEIRFLRKRWDVPGESGSVPQVSGKRLIDVYNKLEEIQALWDSLLGGGFDSSMAFAQALRLNEDVNAVMRTLKAVDKAALPAKNTSVEPEDALSKVFLVLEQVQRLQRDYGLAMVDLSPFRQTENVSFNQVFHMVCLTLAELQTLKAQIGLNRFITPPANYYEDKTPADVEQLLEYIANKLRLIRSL